MSCSDKDFSRYTRSYWGNNPDEQASIVQEHVARGSDRVAGITAIFSYIKTTVFDIARSHQVSIL